MGRHHAGHSFLRAFVAGRTGPVVAMGLEKSTAEEFNSAVSAIDPSAPTHWIAPHDFRSLATHDVLQIPGPGLGRQADVRRRYGSASWSLVGVTHTLSTTHVQAELAAMVAKPVMPWDAVICTSQAARASVVTVLDAQREHLAERLGASRFPTLMLPVIPLGVHTGDFDFNAARKEQARQRLGVRSDEVLAIFTGRLSFHAKAHPLPMYAALQWAAERTGKKIVLAQSSWFANAAIETAFKNGAARYCPAVRAIWSDGADVLARTDVWAAGDIFISLSDNVQETFGLTPVEAMAAGLPAVVTDWDGYRDTIRDGIDGFRIPTTMPAAPFGEELAEDYQAERLNYDLFCAATSLAVSVDMEILTRRLTELVDNPELRLSMGASGKSRARAEYDWTVILGRYRELWAECRAVRLAAKSAGDVPAAPRSAGLDPFAIFASYPTHTIDGSTRLKAGPLFSRWTEIRGHGLFSHVPSVQPRFLRPEAAILAALGSDPSGVGLDGIALSFGVPLRDVVMAAATLAKAGAVIFETQGLE